MIRRELLAVVLLCGALAGCKDDPEPKVEDPPTSAPVSSPSTSPSPSESTAGPADAIEPALPEAATRKSDTGAEAFARYWVELVNYSGATGDDKTLKSVSDSRCAGCTGLLKVIDTTYANGGHIEGGVWTLGGFHRLPLAHGADWAAFAKARATPQLIYDGRGGAKSYRGGPFNFFAYLAWTNSAWAMNWLRVPEASQ